MGKGLIFPFVEAQKDGKSYLAHCIETKKLTEKACIFINNETTYLKSLDFPNVIKRVGNPKWDGKYLLILYEYCNLGSLASYIKSNPLEVDFFKEIAHQLMKALCAFNANDFAVLALTPDTVFLNKDENGRIFIIVCDLMLSTKFNTPMPKLNNFAYLHKNCDQPEAIPQSNIWALGTLLTIISRDLKRDATFFDFIDLHELFRP